MSNFVQLEINARNRWIYFSKYRWVAHIGYWLWVLIVGTIMRAKGPITPSLVYNHFFLENLMIASFFYLYCLFLIPYFFKRNKYFLFWVLVVAGYMTISALDIFWNRSFVHLTDPKPDYDNMSFATRYIYTLGGYLMNFLVFSMMLFFMEKNEENDTILELEKEKKEIELVKLDLLKTNISPDFLLRSLNQLKQAAMVAEAHTPEAILTFSDLLRYRLYRGRQTKSPLKEELNAFESFIHFIDLDHIHDQLNIRFDKQGDPEDKYIAPLSLVNLLEPFCKTLPAHPVLLEIVLLIEQEELFLDMTYHSKAPAKLLADLDEYGLNYTQLYGETVKFHFEDCENNTCIIRLSLPLSETV